MQMCILLCTQWGSTQTAQNHPCFRLQYGHQNVSTNAIYDVVKFELGSEEGPLLWGKRLHKQSITTKRMVDCSRVSKMFQRTLLTMGLHTNAVRGLGLSCGVYTNRHNYKPHARLQYDGSIQTKGQWPPCGERESTQTRHNNKPYVRLL